MLPYLFFYYYHITIGRSSKKGICLAKADELSGARKLILQAGSPQFSAKLELELELELELYTDPTWAKPRWELIAVGPMASKKAIGPTASKVPLANGSLKSRCQWIFGEPIPRAVGKRRKKKTLYVWMSFSNVTHTSTSSPHPFQFSPTLQLSNSKLPILFSSIFFLKLPRKHSPN